MIIGKCNCEAVQFAILSEPKDIYMCHCSICRKATGTNGIGVLVVNNSDFQWQKGQDAVATWKKPNSDWQTWFCKSCGSKVPGDNDSERKFIPVGLIKDDKGLSVTHHIWVDSKAHWDEIGDEGTLHPEAFGTGLTRD